jgi:hypothetical protein
LLRAWGQLYIQDEAPSQSPVVVGSLWFDTYLGVLKKCTQVDPYYVFESVEGGGGGISPSNTVEDLDGTGDAGSSASYSRGDHKHGDSNRPTDGQKAALAGSDGTPDAGNPYVTDSDPRLDNLGDVIGPESSTDNAVVRWDGTSGVYVQDSGVELKDDGDIVGKTFIGTRSGTVNRTGGEIISIELDNGRTLTITRTGGYVSSVTDAIRTWTISRDENNVITGWVVS